MSLIPLLLLADSRLPGGTHAHSGGLEAAVAAGRVHDGETLRAFLLGRLTGVGFTAAAFAAAAALELSGGLVVGERGVQTREAAALDAEYDARTPSPAQRATSRALGRHLLCAVRAGWPGVLLDAVAGLHPDGPHHPIAFGAAAAVAGVDPGGAAEAVALGSVTGPAHAAPRLLGLDPDAVTAVLASLAAQVEQVAAAAAKAARGPVEELPAVGAPLLEIAAQQVRGGQVRFFVS
ncbi:urease accessory protein UreF [Actinocrinis puniceicyclus]|uniref:Urease accessory protein UreF n=1 Tax=Actinocrinis puniceicyclus TaxID=977794 RepID=A0A8J8BFR6_9ACTN|nr:urease accessory UreF family protein [Actinocrinis puniceicyclus]MBS2965004.1 urease accessory protein UreF [Actinocrinis puniceicyclus]